MGFLLSAFVVVVAIVIGVVFLKKDKKQYRWHDGPHWEKLLSMYDEDVREHFGDCESKLVPTRFGKTQVHACGDDSGMPVLFLHGAGSNSGIYSDWLVPPVRKENYAVTVDFPCDVGRSIPQDYDTANCPQTKKELAEWLSEVVTGLAITKPISLVGYSYGSFISMCTAIERPDMVDKLVLIAPACVFAPIEWGFIWRVLLYGMYPNNSTQNWFLTYLSAEEDFNMQKWKENEIALTIAVRELAASGPATTLAVSPEHFDKETLKRVTRDHPTLLIIGEEETVVNATLAAENARDAGVEVKVFPSSGHLMLAEYPRDPVKTVVTDFLRSKEST